MISTKTSQILTCIVYLGVKGIHKTIRYQTHLGSYHLPILFLFYV